MVRAAVSQQRWPVPNRQGKHWLGGQPDARKYNVNRINRRWRKNIVLYLFKTYAI